jgi:predicted RNA-binding protein with RPS1 domain
VPFSGRFQTPNPEAKVQIDILTSSDNGQYCLGLPDIKHGKKERKKERKKRERRRRSSNTTITRKLEDWSEMPLQPCNHKMWVFSMCAQ